MKASAFAPATVANLAVGFDILGLAVHGLGELATVERIPGVREVTLEPIAGFPEISLDPKLNTATAGLVRLIADHRLNFGFRVLLNKQIPIGSGLGGSAASAVASVVAANALLKKKLRSEELYEYAMVGEEVASGSRHGDNVAPCLLGGLVFVRGARLVKVKLPSALRVVVLLPAVTINTKAARSLLSSTVPLSRVVEQTANLSGFLLGCLQRDFSLMKESLRDVMIEPQRASLIPGFAEFQASAQRLGALGCSISGSGPAIFALTDKASVAARLKTAWLKVAEQQKVKVHGCWVSAVASEGARLKKVTR